MFPFWDVAIAPVLARRRRRARRRDRRAAGRDDRADARRPRPRGRAARDRPGARLRPGEHEQRVPRPLRLPPRPQPQRAADAAADGRGAHRRRPQLVHGLQRAAAARPRRAPGRRAAAGDDPARRRLAVRPARPLLRARADPRGVPPAVRAARACARAARSCSPTRRPEPDDVQRGRRGRPAQRRDDRARRLRRRVRPAAARRRAARSTSASPSSSRRSGSRASPSWPRRSTGSRAPTGQDELLELAEDDPAPGDALPAQRLLPARASSSSGRAEPLPRPARRPRCSTSTTSRTRSGSSTSPRCVARRPAARRRRAPRPGAQRRRTRTGALARDRSAPAARDDRRGHRRSCRTPTMGRARLDHLERCLDAVRDRVACPATSSSAAPGAAAARSSCAATSTPTRSPTGAVWVADRFRAVAGADRGADASPHDGVAGFQADLNIVRDGFDRFDLLDDRVRFLQGPLGDDARRRADRADRAAAHRARRSAPTRATSLDALYDRLAVGGVRRRRRPRRRRRAATRSTRSAPTRGIDGAARARRRVARSRGARPQPRRRRGRRTEPRHGRRAPRRRSRRRRPTDADRPHRSSSSSTT